MPDPSHDGSWGALVEMSGKLGEAMGELSSLKGQFTSLAAAVVDHDKCDQQRHLDLLKAGEERQTAITKLIGDGNLQILGAVDALVKRMEDAERILAELPDDEDAAKDGKAAAASFSAFVKETPMSTWIFVSTFIVVTISSILGHPVRWPDPPKVEPPVATVPTSPHDESASPVTAP